MDEYSPWENDKYKGGGQGDAYLDFIIKTLKPYVDKDNRTLFDSPNTAIIGSSLCGLISYYGGLRNTGSFGERILRKPFYGYSMKNV